MAIPPNEIACMDGFGGQLLIVISEKLTASQLRQIEITSNILKRNNLLNLIATVILSYLGCFPSIKMSLLRFDKIEVSSLNRDHQVLGAQVTVQTKTKTK